MTTEAPVTVEAVAAVAVTPASPFAGVRVRWLFAWSLLAFLVFVPAVTSSPMGRRAGFATDPALFDMWYAFACLVGGLWAWRTAARQHLRARRLIGRLPRERQAWVLAAACVAGLGLTGAALSHLLYWAIARLLPRAFERAMLSPQPTLGGQLILAAEAAILAPVLEEFLFRGMILHRWALKWGTSKALLASSAVFALLHDEPVGAFVFALVMGVLYLRTRSLWVPILCHSANNVCGSWGLLRWVITGHPPDVTVASTLDPVRLCLALAGALLALPAGVVFLRRFWPARDAVLPYDANVEPATQPA